MKVETDPALGRFPRNHGGDHICGTEQETAPNERIMFEQYIESRKQMDITRRIPDAEN